MNTFSIVTPSCNQGQFIEDTIRSVLSQIGDFHIEYTVADGGSTDTTVAILKKYDELIQNGHFPVRCNGITYRWWSRKDKGQSAAINEGFATASGNILAWINSDDYYMDGTFAKIVKVFENSDVKFVHGDAYLLDENNRKIKSSAGVYKKSFNGDFHDLTDEDFIHQSTAFFRKNLFIESGGLDENLNLALDYDLWIKMFNSIDPRNIAYMNQPLATYRIWHGAKTYSLKDDARKEKVLLDEKYDMKYISPKITHNPFTSPIFYYMRDHTPWLLKIIKKPINYINNKKRR